MKKIIISFFILAMVAASAFAQESPDSLRDKASNKINIAIQLMTRARDAIMSQKNRDNIMLAMNLYVEAGQLFEQAEGMFKALGAQYASQNDIDNCARAKGECIKAIMECRKFLQGSEQQQEPPKSNVTSVQDEHEPQDKSR